MTRSKPEPTNVVPFVRPDVAKPHEPLMLEAEHRRPMVAAMAMGAINGAATFIEALAKSRGLKLAHHRTKRKALPSAEFMDEKELCATLGIAAVTATKWRAKAEGPPFVKLGRLIRYRRSEVEAWLASNRRGTGQVD